MHNSEQIQFLKALDLNYSEARVYIALLKNERVTAKTISIYSEVGRQEVYRSIASLESLGFVIQTSRKKAMQIENMKQSKILLFSRLLPSFNGKTRQCPVLSSLFSGGRRVCYGPWIGREVDSFCGGFVVASGAGVQFSPIRQALPIIFSWQIAHLDFGLDILFSEARIMSFSLVIYFTSRIVIYLIVVQQSHHSC